MAGAQYFNQKRTSVPHRRTTNAAENIGEEKQTYYFPVDTCILRNTAGDEIAKAALKLLPL